MTLLDVRDLVVRFRTRDGVVHAVNGVTFALDPGETLGLVGESGCGKSVTSLAIMRLLPKPAGHIEGGSVTLEDEDLLPLSEEAMREIRGRDIAMVFQDPMSSLNPVLTIEEQMVETIQAHEKVSNADARRRAIELLGMVGIPQPENRLSAFPHQFSGGMRQRVMIAMALALRPKLLIADEPTTALDVTIQAQVLELLKDLTSTRGTAVILITHDLGVVAGMTQRTMVMYAGFIVEAGTTAAIYARPSHPYTVGLLHSIPRLDRGPEEPLIPIEGVPPDQRHAPVGCPFAPRCAWRVKACWVENPALVALDGSTSIAQTGPDATHRIACHNPPTAEEAQSGLPHRPGFRPAQPPGEFEDEVVENPGILDAGVPGATVAS
jgi:oligopeptide transport system ATP-binding protein